MRREGTLEELSDGRLYTSNDMVRAGCGDCSGCSSCCRTVGNTIILDPYDIYSLTIHLKTSFTELLRDKIELNIADGVILPNISVSENGDGCGFLDKDGRCSIHDFRPGFCRLYPLGRYYADGSFKYILLKDECKKENRTKVKISSFLGIENLRAYEEYICDWHYYIKEIGQKITDSMAKGNDNEAKAVSMGVLQKFFTEPYVEGDFYEQYYERRKQ